MASIVNGKFLRDDMTSKAMGGTELLAHRLVDNVPKKYLRDFQIHLSRTTDKDKTKRQVLWCHDLAKDPAVKHLANGGWKQYEKIIFVSRWQQKTYNSWLGVPYDHGVVIENAIEPIPFKEKTYGTIRLIYTSTPHRGLEILYPVFEALSERYSNIVLDVFSSFELYGWSQRDKLYEKLFDRLKSHPRIQYHGAQSNQKVREALQKSHIFAYPSIWPETSCLCLIEAMSAGNICVHSNLAALPETSMGLTNMYQIDDDVNKHAQIFANQLVHAIEHIESDATKSRVDKTKKMCDDKHNIDSFSKKWIDLLRSC